MVFEYSKQEVGGSIPSLDSINKEGFGVHVFSFSGLAFYLAPFYKFLFVFIFQRLLLKSISR